jgi:predicted nucleotidyltransferase
MIERHLQLFACLNRRGVEYLLIGGALAIAYGVPRVTADIDLFVRATPENTGRCLDALKECGLGTASLTTPEELCANEITIFKDVIRLDILTAAKGIVFSEVWSRRVHLELDEVLIPALSLPDLIQSKRAAARPSDLQDITILEKSLKQSS